MRRFTYGTELDVLAQLEVMMKGQENAIMISTNDTSLYTTNNIISSEIYAGECCDWGPHPHARRKRYNGDKTKFSAGTLPPLTSPNAAPFRVTVRLQPQGSINSKSDFPSSTSARTKQDGPALRRYAGLVDAVSPSDMLKSWRTVSLQFVNCEERAQMAP